MITAFAIMPGVGKVKFKEDDRASWFSHKAEVSPLISIAFI
jgi:hypothetical protein